MIRSLSRYTGLKGSFASTVATIGLVCLSSTAQAATVFTETFANGLNGFTAAGTTATGAFGVRVSGSFGGTDGVVTSGAISTTGFSNIRLSFTRATVGLDAGEAGIASVSINGGAFTTVDSQRTINARVTVPLAAAAANSSIRIRFAINASLSTETYTVSNVLLEGDAANNPDPNPDPNPNPNPGPASCTNLAAGTFNCTIASAGGNRTYITYVPALYNRANAVPLVIDMHGFTSTAAAQMRMSGWRQLSDTQNFIVAYPQGLGNSWNAQGQCCGDSTADDPQFIRDVVSAISRAGSINARKVYATGLSNGGSMSHTMACVAADVFAAAGPVSFTLSGGNTTAAIVANCRPSQPVGVLEFHGLNDNLVPFNSGVLDAIGARESLAAWVQIQACSNTPATTTPVGSTSCQIHSGCGGTGNQVGLCAVTGGTHVLYPNVPAPGIAKVLWDFFQAQPPR